jgi:tetratricopeptide (TPR) repeat protein
MTKTNLLDTIATQLRHFTQEEIIALVGDFLVELDEKPQTRFLNMVTQGPRPLVAEAMGFDDIEYLLEEIQILRDAIDNEVYVEYGVGYDPDYGSHRGYGDDSWIDEMDSLFDAATSFFRAGQFKAAAEAYIALFDMFTLAEDGFKFTRPNPSQALHTDIDAMKENLFIAIGRSYAEAATDAIEVSGQVLYYGSNRYALLDAWQGREEWMIALETALIDHARQSTSQGPYHHIMSHPVQLLREFYNRYRTLPDYESLCRRIGPQQGWLYQELVNRYRDREDWEQVLSWAEDGLEKLPADSQHRSQLQEARGQALLQLDRPAEALGALQSLFQQDQTALIYLKLRQAAQATAKWEALYPQLVAHMQAQVPLGPQKTGYPIKDLTIAVLLGYAYLLEGDWQTAFEWASNPAVPSSWGDHSVADTVAAGLLRMGLVARSDEPDETMAQALGQVPQIIRDYGQYLEPVARTLAIDPLLDTAVQLYERLVERAIASGKQSHHYDQAGAYCRTIQTIRRVQDRQADFDRYYQGLLTTYSRYSALKRDLHRTVEG